MRVFIFACVSRCLSHTHQGREGGRDGMIQIKKQLQGGGIQKGCV